MTPPAAPARSPRQQADPTHDPGRWTDHGLFLVFEGGDGVGKTTQVRAVLAWLAAAGIDAVSTFEPGDTAVGRRIRNLVLDPATGDVDARAEALLYAADKAQHLFGVVEPALARGSVVVCDRYVDSMLAYQGAGRALSLSEVEGIARWATGDLRPDLTVLLDLGPELAVARLRNKDRLEGAGVEFHQRARAFFLDLAAADPDHYLVLPARLPRHEISAAIQDRVKPLLVARGLSAGAGTMPT
ncbi:MAG: dTMP kinase [Propionibacteriaceae bacterium]